MPTDLPCTCGDTPETDCRSIGCDPECPYCNPEEDFIPDSDPYGHGKPVYLLERIGTRE